jgi:hypothetical protein
MSRSVPTKPRDTHPIPAHDPVAPWCADVLGLFSGPLGEVRFPDVDQAILESGVEAVRRAQLEVESLEHALDEARVRTRDANLVLADLCGRALAYARVFASAQPELQPALAAVRTPSDRASHELAPRKRGRPRKDSATATLLPDDAAVAAQ